MNTKAGSIWIYHIMHEGYQPKRWTSPSLWPGKWAKGRYTLHRLSGLSVVNPYTSTKNLKESIRLLRMCHLVCLPLANNKCLGRWSIIIHCTEPYQRKSASFSPVFTHPSGCSLYLLITDPTVIPLESNEKYCILSALYTMCLTICHIHKPLKLVTDAGWFMNSIVKFSR